MKEVTNNDVILSIKNIYKNFDGNSVLNGVSLDVNKGDRIVIIGPSGCGKSTMLRCINQMEQIDNGEIWFHEKLITPLTKKNNNNIKNIKAYNRENVLDINIARQKIGMVFQHFNLFNNLNVLDNLILAPVQLKLMSKEEAIEKAKSYLMRIGLLEKKDAFPSVLSGGQKQRLAIIRSLMLNPEIMLFDEATSALDPEMVKEVLELMNDLADKGMTMLIVTHEMAFAKKIASRVIFLNNGVIEEEGTAEKIFNNPSSIKVREFIDKIL